MNVGHLISMAEGDFYISLGCSHSKDVTFLRRAKNKAVFKIESGSYMFMSIKGAVRNGVSN